MNSMQVLFTCLYALDFSISASNTPPQCVTSPNASVKCLTLVEGRAFVRESATISLVGQ